ncbi:MAG: patatin-like phospholipase family protein [Caldisericaceae bacterium]|nr:patatin-like phospholipase family protein [Caldisericaceae bacterium]
MKIALVLGSGAARGLAHIGVLKALEKEGIPVDLIVGCSMGAMVGGAYAAGLNSQQIEEIACETNWKRVVQLLFPKRFSRSGLLDGQRVEEFLLSLLGEEAIENLPRKFACVATDIRDGEEIILNSGSLVNAIRASISFPFLFQPVKLNGNYLVDGGVVNPVPVSVAREMKADLIIAVNVTPSVKHRARTINSGQLLTQQKLVAASSASSFLQRLFGNFMDRLPSTNPLPSKKQPDFKMSIQQQMAHVAMTMENMILTLRLQETPPDLLITPAVSSYQFFDFYKAHEIISVGRQAMEAEMKQLEKLLKMAENGGMIGSATP